VTPTGGGTVTGTVNAQAFSCSGTCSASGAAGAAVTLTAAPATGYAFSGWTGCASTNGTSCITPALTGAINVTAAFTSSAALTYTLTAPVTNRTTGFVTQTITVTNHGAALSAAAFAAVGLPAGVTMANASGTTAINSPGAPYIALGPIGAGGTVSATIQFSRTGTQTVAYTVLLLAGTAPY